MWSLGPITTILYDLTEIDSWGENQSFLELVVSTKKREVLWSSDTFNLGRMMTVSIYWKRNLNVLLGCSYKLHCLWTFCPADEEAKIAQILVIEFTSQTSGIRLREQSFNANCTITNTTGGQFDWISWISCTLVTFFHSNKELECSQNIHSINHPFENLLLLYLQNVIWFKNLENPTISFSDL